VEMGLVEESDFVLRGSYRATIFTCSEFSDKMYRLATIHALQTDRRSCAKCHT